MRIPISSSVEGDWMKVGKDVKDGDRLQIKDAGQVIEGKFGEQTVFKVMTKDKQTFNLAMNRTTQNNLAKGYGEESEEWVGKVASAFVVKQMVGDGLKNILYLAPDGWTMTDDGEFVNPNEDNIDPGAIDRAMDKVIEKNNPF